MKKTLVLAFLVFVLAACAPAGPRISIDTVWGRQSPKTATAGAFYLIIHNTGSEADRLTGATSAACGTMELHESYQTADGVMGMRPVEGGAIEVAAGATVELKVGGLHIMCIEKKQDFTSGTQIDFTLIFEKSGEVPVTADIREQ